MIPTMHNGGNQQAPAADTSLNRNAVFSDIFTRLTMAQKAAADVNNLEMLQRLLSMHIDVIRSWDR